MAIDLLQANKLRLRQMIEQTVQENPLLEIDAILAEGSGTLDLSNQEPQVLDFSQPHFEWIEELNEDFHHHFDETYSAIEIKSDKVWEENRQDPLSFQPYILQGEPWLENQLLQLCDNPSLRQEALWLASYTDNQGLLEKPLTQLAEENEKDLIKLQKAKNLLQQLEPKGYGSESLQEAIQLQLEAKGLQDCLCHEIVSKYWEDLTHRQWEAIAKKTHSSAQHLEYEIEHHLKGLHTQFNLEALAPLTEDAISLDLVIEFEEGKANVKLLDTPTTWIKLQSHYLQATNDEETKNYLKQKRLECLWLLKALAEREKNLLLVSQAIATWQKDYLNSQGPLKPLVLKDIAQLCELHESTVARACQDKLAQTPIGVLPLKSLFCSKVTSETGQNISSVAICEKIQAWIKQEDPHHPLSDEEIVQKLKSHGISCARRTIAKYRLRLGIAASHLRKMP